MEVLLKNGLFYSDMFNADFWFYVFSRKRELFKLVYKHKDFNNLEVLKSISNNPSINSFEDFKASFILPLKSIDEDTNLVIDGGDVLGIASSWHCVPNTLTHFVDMTEMSVYEIIEDEDTNPFKGLRSNKDFIGLIREYGQRKSLTPPASFHIMDLPEGEDYKILQLEPGYEVVVKADSVYGLGKVGWIFYDEG